jgi:hypothetical protein
MEPLARARVELGLVASLENLPEGRSGNFAVDSIEPSIPGHRGKRLRLARA